MQKFSRTEKIWLILFALVLIGLIGGCMYETVVNHRPIGPRPTRKLKVQSGLLRKKCLPDSFCDIL
jgi:hypothetical protein